MKKIKKKIGFIGCGNMGEAILAGLLRNRIVSRSQIHIAEVDAGRRGSLEKKFGVKTTDDLEKVLSRVDVVILAVKPQAMTSLNIEGGKNKLFISILAGKTIADIKKALGVKKVIRVMPNLGAIVGESMTAIASSRGASVQSVNIAKAIFSACGEVVTVKESQMDAVTAVSGSGPVYFFYLTELLEKSAIKNGLSKAQAKLLAEQTAFGAIQVLGASLDGAEALKKKVTSKKGTTEAALKTFKQKKMDIAFDQGIRAAIRRGKELSKGK